jgi:hypothetical protein
MFIASYGIYGYFIALLYPFCPNITHVSILIIMGWLSLVGVYLLKLKLNPPFMVSGMNSIPEATFWLSLSLALGYCYYPKARQLLIAAPPFKILNSHLHLTEPSIFLIFFSLCLLAQIFLLIMGNRITRKTLHVN